MSLLDRAGAEADPGSGAAGMSPAFTAARARIGLVLALFAIAAVSWAWSADLMTGMDGGPWTGLSGLWWFLGVWVLMMAAMMLPSVSPTVALYARMTRRHSAVSAYFFVAGYLLIWTAAGLFAYAIGALASLALDDAVSWDNGGRWLAGGTLILAAVYELTPLKDVCLGRCRSPLGALLGSWRDGLAGAVRMGVRNGAWCVGCCWALMAALFALGFMSLAWMALVAGIIAAEKTLPWRAAVTYTAAGLLLVLGMVVLIAPDALPGMTIPQDMEMMS